MISYLFSEPLFFLTWVIAIVIAISVHEFSHAYAAYKLGDPTPERDGRLTLNPLKHLDWLGTLLLLFVGFGWGKPVQYNPYNIRNQRWGHAIIAFAGPLSNLVLALIFGFGLRLLVTYGVLFEGTLLVTFIANVVMLNVILMIFNLIPIPPLDGSKILFAFLPGVREETKLRFEQYGPFLLLALLLLGQSFLAYLFGLALKALSFIIGFPLLF